MTSHLTLAQLHALADPDIARRLHVLSLIRGRLDAHESAVASQDARAQLESLSEAGELFQELLKLSLQRRIA